MRASNGRRPPVAMDTTIDGFRAQDYLQAKAVMSQPLPVITNG